MKKVLSIFILCTTIAGVYAQQGTCSWHGGVDCSAGADWDGSAICNDGWTDSSEDFYSIKSCTENLHSCSEAEWVSLKEKYNLDSKIALMKPYYEQLDVISKQLPVTNTTDSTQKSRENSIKLLNLASEAIKVRSKIDTLQYDYNSSLTNAKRLCYAKGETEYNTVKYYATRSATTYQPSQPVTEIKTTPSCPENSEAVNGVCSCKIGSTFDGSRCVVKPVKMLISKNLKIGSTGSDVAALQDFLRTQRLYNSSSTGKYDTNTYNSVYLFQSRNKIQQTGTVGNITRAKINSIINK